MTYKFLFCIFEKQDRDKIKDILIKRGLKYNDDFKIKKDKSETFNFWIRENLQNLKDELRSEVFIK